MNEPDIIEILREEEKQGKLDLSKNKKPGLKNLDLYFLEKNVYPENHQDAQIVKIDEKNEFNKFLVRYSKDLHELIFQKTSDLMFYLDKSGNILKVNQNVLSFSGLEQDEILGKPIWLLSEIFGGNIESSIKVFKKSFKKKISGKTVGELNDKSGNTHIMEFSIYPVIKDHKVLYVLVKAKDVTDYKIKEEALKATEKSEKKYRELAEHYSILAENTLSIIFQTTKTGKITYISSAVEKIAGYKPEEMIGKKFTKFVPIKEMPKYFSVLKNALAGNEIGSFETYVYHKNGSLIPVEYDGKIIKKQNEIFILGTIRDITERKKAEEELKKAHEELEKRVKERTIELSKTNEKLQAEIIERKKTEEKLKFAHEKLQALNLDLEKKIEERTAEVNKLLKQKDEFINQLGHDLKNPLNPLVNLVPYLEKYADNEKTYEILKILKRNVGYMKNLVTKTLVLARLNSPSTKFLFEEINLHEEINNVIEKNKMMFEEKNIQVVNNVPEDITINVDKLRIEELFDNLLNNAAKYSKKKGKITVNSQEYNDEIKISISDEGIGMTPEQINHVFDEFYKADTSRHDFDSSGLGLTICKKIVEKHNGKIWIESKGKNKGTKVIFVLPKNKKPNS